MIKMIRFSFFLLKLAILGGVVVALLTSPNWIRAIDRSKPAQVVQSGVKHVIERVGKAE